MSKVQEQDEVSKQGYSLGWEEEKMCLLRLFDESQYIHNKEGLEVVN